MIRHRAVLTGCVRSRPAGPPRPHREHSCLDEAPRPPPRHEQTDAQADDGPTSNQSPATCEDTNRRAGSQQTVRRPFVLPPAVHLTYATADFASVARAPAGAHGRLRPSHRHGDLPRATLLGTSGTETPNNTALNGLRTGWTGAARALWVVLSVGTEWPLLPTARCPCSCLVHFQAHSRSEKPGGVAMMTMIWNLTTGQMDAEPLRASWKPVMVPGPHEHRGQRGAGRGAQRLLTHHHRLRAGEPAGSAIDQHRRDWTHARCPPGGQRSPCTPHRWPPRKR